MSITTAQPTAGFSLRDAFTSVLSTAQSAVSGLLNVSKRSVIAAATAIGIAPIAAQAATVPPPEPFRIILGGNIETGLNPSSVSLVDPNRPGNLIFSTDGPFGIVGIPTVIDGNQTIVGFTPAGSIKLAPERGFITAFDFAIVGDTPSPELLISVFGDTGNGEQGFLGDFFFQDTKSFDPLRVALDLDTPVSSITLTSDFGNGSTGLSEFNPAAGGDVNLGSRDIMFAALNGLNTITAPSEVWIQFQAVPVPAAAPLLVTALGALALYRRRSARSATP